MSTTKTTIVCACVRAYLVQSFRQTHEIVGTQNFIRHGIAIVLPAIELFVGVQKFQGRKDLARLGQVGPESDPRLVSALAYMKMKVLTEHSLGGMSNDGP